ncbi:hypothetical protein U1Q18_048550 [Sarracenia purpurea var. burkii]
MIGVENLERKTSLRIRRDVKVKYSYIKLEPQASNGIVRQVGSNYRCMVGSGTIRKRWRGCRNGRRAAPSRTPAISYRGPSRRPRGWVCDSLAIASKFLLVVVVVIMMAAKW